MRPSSCPYRSSTVFSAASAVTYGPEYVTHGTPGRASRVQPPDVPGDHVQRAHGPVMFRCCHYSPLSVDRSTPVVERAGPGPDPGTGSRSCYDRASTCLAPAPCARMKTSTATVSRPLRPAHAPQSIQDNPRASDRHSMAPDVPDPSRGAT